MSDIKLYQGDCLEVMKQIPDKSIDLTVTSPPYDNLRTYNGNVNQWCYEKFQGIANELYRITKDGGVIVWVVNDATIKGSETGSSFRQALYFKDIGFNLHDTMIWHKKTVPYDPKCNRYWQTFEYMFVFSKGKPICNYITEPCKRSGETTNYESSHKTIDGNCRERKVGKVKDTKVKSNIWYFAYSKAIKGHPAQFPYQLAYDHIISWSNEGDTILDCFMGSGTTGVAAKNLNRDFIGIELDDNYYHIAEERIKQAQINPEVPYKKPSNDGIKHKRLF